MDFQRCARIGLEQARASLSVFMGKDPDLELIDADFVDLRSVPLLSGDPESVVLASYASFSGDAEGQLVMLFRPDTAEGLAAFVAPEILGDIREEEMPSFRESLLLEVANVVGSSVLNAVADNAMLRLSPTPPVLVRDMAGAILGSAMSFAGASEAIYVVHIRFTLYGGRASFEIILLPKVRRDLDKLLGDQTALCTT